MTENALIIAETLDPVKVFTGGGLSAVLDEIRKKVDEFEPDLSTGTSRKEIASMARKVSSSKALIDGLGKSLVAEWKKKAKSVDVVRKEARDFLDQLRDEVREPLSKWEAEEELKDQARIAGIRRRIEGFSASHNKLKGKGTVEQLEAIIAELEAIKIEPDQFFEFTQEGIDIRQTVIDRAKQDLETRIRLDKEAAGQKAEAERQAIVRKQQEEANAKIQAVQKKLDAEKRELEDQRRKIEEAKHLEAAKKEAAERALKDAEEKKLRDEAETKRRESLRPDKEKLNVFAYFLQNEIVYPDVDNEKTQAILTKVEKDIYKTGEFLLDQARRM